MNDPVIEPARPEDIEAIVAIERASFPRPWSQGAFTSELTRDHTLFWVVREGGKPVAYLVAWNMVDHMYLANIAVEPQHRGKGLAKAMIKELIRECRRREVWWLVLDVRVSNEPAIAFYEKMGFKRLKRNRRFYGNEDGFTYALMLDRESAEG